MSTWIKINSSTSKQVPDGTIGTLINQTTNYYLIQHWALNKTIQEKKVNCEIYDDIIGKKYWYKDHLRRIPCTRFKVINYAEDYDSGNGSYVQMTGKRVLLEPVNELTSYRDLVEQRVIAPVADLDNCTLSPVTSTITITNAIEQSCSGNPTNDPIIEVSFTWANMTTPIDAGLIYIDGVLSANPFKAEYIANSSGSITIRLTANGINAGSHTIYVIVEGATSNTYTFTTTC